MGVPMVNSCCFCASLHTGTLVIGYSYTVWALLELAGYCLLVTLAPLGQDADGLSAHAHKRALFIAAAAFSAVNLLCSLLLILAAYKKLASLTLPWTMATGVMAAAFFVMGLTGVSLVLQDSGDTLAAEAAFIATHLARALISVYSIVVVHSRHKQIMCEEDARRLQHSARLCSPVRSPDSAHAQQQRRQLLSL